MQPLSQTLFALALTVAIIGWLVRQIWKSAAPSDRLVGLLILIVLLAWRWPPLTSQVEFNPDESQLGAGAVTLAHDPVFWRSVDGTTSGPLNFYVLVPVLSIGGLPPIFAVRLTGLLLVWLGLDFSFKLLRRACGYPSALLGLLPAWIFFATVTDGDFIHYSSEHLSLCLLALAAWFLWRGAEGNGAPSGWRWLAAGFTAGLLPWAKLQSGPLALALGTTAMMFVVRAEAASPATRARSAISFCAAALLPALGFMAMVLVTGQFKHFYQSYLLNNIVYTSNPTTVLDALINLRTLTTITWSFPLFLFAVLASSTVTLLAALTAGNRPDRFFWLSTSAVMGALACILIPRLGFPHYLLYLVLPAAWWVTACIQLCWESRSARRNFLVALVLIFAAGAPVATRFIKGFPVGFTPLDSTDIPVPDKLAGVLSQFTQAGDTLAVWGWSPRINLETRLPQGTRDGNNFRQIEESVQRDGYYRPRFLRDFTRNCPAVFVDAVGPGLFRYTDRAHAGHETFPALGALIERDYKLLTDVFGARIYVRRDLVATRAAELQHIENEIRELQARGEIPSPLPDFNVPRRFVYGREVFHLQTPSEVTWNLAGDEREFLFSYGFEPEAYIRGDSNGAEIEIELLVPGELPRQLFSRFLNPKTVSADRGLHTGRATLPPCPPGSQLRVRTLPGEYNDNAWDWVFLSDPRFVRTIGRP